MVGKLTDDRHMSCSRLAGLMGCSPWSTPNDELLFSSEARKGKEREDIQNEAMAWGDILEPVILREVGVRLSTEIETNISVPFTDKQIPLSGSIDGFANGDNRTLTTDRAKGIYVMTDSGTIELRGKGVIEAKVTRMQPEDPPPRFRGLIQLQGQMMCTSCGWGCVAVLYHGTELRLYLFEPHPESWAVINEEVKDFERRLQSDPPDWYEIESPEEASRVFSWTDNDDDVIDLPDDLLPTFGDLLAAKRMISFAQETLKETSAAIMEAMGNHSKARIGNHLAVWPMRHSKAQPEKIVPAKPATSKRQQTLSIKELEIEDERTSNAA